MPIYEYVCDTCGEDFEVMQKFSDPPLTRHTCGPKSKVRRKLSLTAFQLKGGGWYKEGYSGIGGSVSGNGSSGEGASGGNGSSAAKEKAGSDGSKADAGSSLSAGSAAKSDSKSSGSAGKSDSKSSGSAAKSDGKPSGTSPASA